MRHRRLDQEARFEEVLHLGTLEVEVQARHATEVLAARTRVHGSSGPARPEHEDALDLEDPQRLAHGRTTDAVLLEHRRFQRQRLTGHAAPLHQPLDDLVGNGFCELLPPAVSQRPTARRRQLLRAGHCIGRVGGELRHGYCADPRKRRWVGNRACFKCSRTVMILIRDSQEKHRDGTARRPRRLDLRRMTDNKETAE